MFELLEHAAMAYRLGNEPCPSRTIDEELSAFADSDRLLRAFARLAEREIDTLPLFEIAFTQEGVGVGPVSFLPQAYFDIGYQGTMEASIRRLSRYRSSNGYAAGMSFVDAALHALNEVVERQALGALIFETALGRPAGATIDLSSSSMRELSRVIEKTHRCNLSLQMLPAALPTVVAFSEMVDVYGRRMIGMGTSGSITYAAHRALLEFDQEAIVESEIAAGEVDHDAVDVASPHIVNHPRIWRASTLIDVVHPRPVRSLPADPAEPTRTVLQLQKAVRSISSQGCRPMFRTVYAPCGETLYCDHVHPCVVQAVVPGYDRVHLARHGLAVEPTGMLARGSGYSRWREDVVLGGRINGREL